MLSNLVTGSYNILKLGGESKIQNKTYKNSQFFCFCSFFGICNLSHEALRNFYFHWPLKTHLLEEWVRAVGAMISGIVLVDKQKTTRSERFVAPKWASKVANAYYQQQQFSSNCLVHVRLQNDFVFYLCLENRHFNRAGKIKTRLHAGNNQLCKTYGLGANSHLYWGLF